MVAAILLFAALQVSGSPEAAFDHEHAAWTLLLKEHVHAGGLLDYAGLSERRSDVNAYLASLRGVSAAAFASWSPAQREAFWINAYNAWTISLILDNPKVKSIRDLGGWFSSVFDQRFIPLQHLDARDSELSLGELEHQILGKSARTPLFHFAIVCASRSCPELRAEAYRADQLDAQLADQARRFLADAAKNDLSIQSDALRISKI